MRDYPNLPAPREVKTKKKKKLLAKARTLKANEVKLSDLAVLANRLRFESNEISALMLQSLDREIARDALLRAQNQDLYDYDDGDIDSHVEQILGLFATAKPRNTEQLCPALISDSPDAAGPRCGFPNEEAYARDRKFLYISNLHADQEEQGESITSFFVRRSVYLAFFGRLPEMSTHCSFSPAPPPNAEVALEMDEERLRENRHEEERLQRERSERDSLEQVNGDRNDAQGVDDSYRALERDRRRDTHIDLERIIARGLASIREVTKDPPEHSEEQNLDR
ncbi:hypothetical protein V500_07610 [Pseudogymnoascus sp. VKM F-4518 (FW-2643)]|nr:hypothetical protein V500_07610 [Pseudogymnoascus sp. VKM F-4518 (FW-2643)]